MSKSKWPRIQPLKTKGKRVVDKIRTFDIETDGLGGEFIAVGWLGSSDSVLFSSDWHGFVFDVLLADDFSLWTAHNLGGYESLYFFDAETAELLIDAGWSAEAIGPKGRPCLLLFRHAESGREVRVWDSYSLIRMPLGDATKLFNKEYLKSGDIDFAKETFDLSIPRHKEYLRLDVLSLRELCYSFRAYFIDAFGVEPGYSLPSSGVRAWRRTMAEGTEYRNITTWGENRIRNAYRGGRVIPNSSEIHERIIKYDFNSMYPAVMREFGVPIGPDDWSPYPVPNRPGFLHLIVRVPEDNPPWRCVLSDEDKRFPTGTFETWTTTAEWEQAQEWGAEELEFIEGIYFRECADVFGSFVDLCETLRGKAKAEGKKPLEKMVKLCQNSLYGKFGQRREVLSIQISPENIGQPIEVNGEISDYVYEVDAETNTNQIMPHWAAWITAQARLKLVRSIDVIGDRFVYADTDSILVSINRNQDAKVNADAIASGYNHMGLSDGKVEGIEGGEGGGTGELPTGTRYGDLKNEGEITEFFVVAPKTYSGFDADNEHVCAAKGIPVAFQTRANLEAARAGDPPSASIETVRSLKASVKFGKAITITRRFPTPASSRMYMWDSSTGMFNAPTSNLVYTEERYVRSDTKANRSVASEPAAHGTAVYHV